MPTLWEALKEEHDWTGSLDELVMHSNALAESFPVAPNRHLPLRTRATAMDYRSQKIISPAHGKSFFWLHLVQFCAARYLVDCGWKRNEVAAWVQPRSVGSILETVVSSVRPQPSETREATDPPEVVEDLQQRAYLCTRLLAAGIVGQYQSARRGMPVIHDNTLDAMLSRAMMILAGLYIKESKEDTAGSVHDLLKKCTLPLNDSAWGLDVFRHPEFPYRTLRLIDPDARLPTLDCVELATQTKSELDLREQLAFEALRSTADQFAVRAAEVYSLLRSYIVEHPVTTLAELRDFERDKDLQPARGFLLSCYEPVLAHHLVSGHLHICPGCRIPMGRARLAQHVACRTTQCEQFDRPVATGEVEPVHEELRIAKPHVLAYWIAPGVDELAIYRKALECGLSPTIYPDRDSCDIALDGGRTGIDVKSNASPFLLAESLSRSLHGLALYDLRIVAINNQCAARVPGYLDVLRREYRGKTEVEFMLVGTLLDKLEEPR